MAQYDLIVIGSGPGGYVCAIRAAQLGLKTAIVEKEKTFGGTCLNIGCIPSKALLHASELYDEAGHTFSKMGIGIGRPKLDLKAMMAFKDQGVEGNVKGVEFLLKKNKVDAFHGIGAHSPRPAKSRSRPRTARRKRWRRRISSSPPAPTSRGSRASRSTRSASCPRPGRWCSTRCRSACWWSAPASSGSSSARSGGGSARK